MLTVLIAASLVPWKRAERPADVPCQTGWRETWGAPVEELIAVLEVPFRTDTPEPVQIVRRSTLLPGSKGGDEGVEWFVAFGGARQCLGFARYSAYGGGHWQFVGLEDGTLTLETTRYPMWLSDEKTTSALRRCRLETEMVVRCEGGV